MSLVNNIVYQLFDQVVPRDVLPKMTVSSDSMAYGTIDMELPLSDSTPIITARVYQTVDPTVATDDRWSRIQPDLLPTYPDALSHSVVMLDDGHWEIGWQFAPSVIPYASHGQKYSVEFSVNSTPDASVAQCVPKVIVIIKNPIDFTGVTGVGPGSFAGITGPQGMTGLQGSSGLRGATGPQGMTGLQGATGIQGATGPQGTQGVTGLQGNTGIQGATGLEGIQGATGLEGIQGATGIQGLTGPQGITGTASGVGPGIVNRAAKFDTTSSINAGNIFSDGTTVGILAGDRFFCNVGRSSASAGTFVRDSTMMPTMFSDAGTLTVDGRLKVVDASNSPAGSGETFVTMPDGTATGYCRFVFGKDSAGNTSVTILEALNASFDTTQNVDNAFNIYGSSNDVYFENKLGNVKKIAYKVWSTDAMSNSGPDLTTSGFASVVGDFSAGVVFSGGSASFNPLSTPLSTTDLRIDLDADTTQQNQTGDGSWDLPNAGADASATAGPGRLVNIADCTSGGIYSSETGYATTAAYRGYDCTNINSVTVTASLDLKLYLSSKATDEAYGMYDYYLEIYQPGPVVFSSDERTFNYDAFGEVFSNSDSSAMTVSYNFPAPFTGLLIVHGIGQATVNTIEA